MSMTILKLDEDEEQDEIKFDLVEEEKAIQQVKATDIDHLSSAALARLRNEKLLGFTEKISSLLDDALDSAKKKELLSRAQSLEELESALGCVSTAARTVRTLLDPPKGTGETSQTPSISTLNLAVLSDWRPEDQKKP